MAKQQIEKYIPRAYKVLLNKNISILDQSKQSINGKFRSQIASFGAAVSMGSFKSAVAFFSEKGGADVAREELMKALYLIVWGKDDNLNTDNPNARSLFNKIISFNDNSLDKAKADIMDAAVALKLAMNAFNIV